tara:strand:- start:132 stop:1475 length:1344 start_codon:yes stop_codon:yes gene_type:complete
MAKKKGKPVLAKKSASPKGGPASGKKKQSKLRVKKEKEQKDSVHKAKIRVIGIGGGGGSIVAEISKSVPRADFVVANTDLQALKALPKNVRIFSFGEELTHGRGCGMDVEMGENTAKTAKDRLKKLMEGQDICILVSSLGGGTGSGASPIFAEAAKEARCLTMGIFTTPFSFEGAKRKEIADAALERITPLLNAYVMIPNENIFRIIDQKTPLKGAFSAVNRNLADTLEGFIDTLAMPGLINIDFSDIRTLLEGRRRLAYLHSVLVQGLTKPQLVLKEVLTNPLFDYGITGVDRMVFNITGDKGMKMQEAAEISRGIANHNLKAKIIFGLSFQPQYKDKIRISLFAIGCKLQEEQKAQKAGKRRALQKKTDIPSQEEPREKKQTKKKAAKEKKTAPDVSPPAQRKEVSKVRRNALDLKKEQDKELKEIEKQERQWDIPSFLRNTSHG